jgi:hypothetical protein
VLFGTGVLTGAEERCVSFTQENENCEVRGITITDFRATADGQQAFDFGAGGPGDVRRPIDCGVVGVRFIGSTWDTSTAYADAIKGTAARAPEGQGANYVTDCYFSDVPRRAIFGPNHIVGNRIVNPTPTSGVGGDAITGYDLIANNTLIGTFDSDGDNGIIVAGPATVEGNYVEGFSNNGIGFDLGFPPDVEMVTITGNKLVDNNQRATSVNGNLKLNATEGTGGFTVGRNTCWGQDIDPLNNIIIGSGADNGRVTENVTKGATTNIDDSSPASTTVTNNVQI